MSVARPSFSDFWSLRYSAGGGPVTAVLSQRIGAITGWLLCRAGLSPNVITLLAGFCSLLAAYQFAFAGNDWQGVIAPLLLYQLAYGLDCADGQVARATGRGSEFGAWLDVSVDAVAILALSFALLMYCQNQLAEPVVSPLLITCLTAGRVLQLYSVPAIKASTAAQRSASGHFRGAVKTLLWLVIDTPVFLALVCLLRLEPVWLLAYAAFMALAYTLTAINNGMRLRAG